MKRSIILCYYFKVCSLSIYFVTSAKYSITRNTQKENLRLENILKKAGNPELVLGSSKRTNISSRRHSGLEPLGSFLGGRYPLYAEYPFLVNIVIKETKTSHCAGTIISEYFVITSCHCTCYDNGRGEIVAEKADKFLVFAGAQAAWSIGMRSNLSQVREVWKVIKYFYCSRDKETMAWDHDVSTLTMKNRLFFNEFIKPARIKSVLSKEIEREFEKTMAIKKTCTVVGWGKGKETGVLQSIDLYPISSFLCQSSINDKSYTHIFERYRICFRPFDMLSTAMCVSNTGGPLICDHHLWGILNWAPSCTTTPIPIVFTRLETFIDLYAPLSEASHNKFTSIIPFFVFFNFLFFSGY